MQNNEAAVLAQVSSCLAFEVQYILPKLYGIQSLLHQLGLSANRNPNLEELRKVSKSLASYLETLSELQSLTNDSEVKTCLLFL